MNVYGSSMTPTPLRDSCRVAGCAQGAVEPVRRIARRADDGPISGEAVTDRMMAICGCKGVHNCNCVTVENQARRELWTEHNERQRQAPGGLRHCRHEPMSENIVRARTLIVLSEVDGFFSEVTAHMVLAGKNVQIAAASIARSRAPRVNYEVPESVAFQDVPELTRLLSEFASSVAEVNRKANPEAAPAGA